MYGVVIWSNCTERKAIIWCEDHGDLAFYADRNASEARGPMPDAGDLVQFQVCENAKLRVACTPRVIAEQEFPTLAQKLRSSLPEGGNVVRFRPRQGRVVLAS